MRNNFFFSKNIMEINFQTNKKFNFIQVGANDGISFDFLYEFIMLRDSEGIVIEPVKEYFNELNLNYSNCPKIIKINKAVHPLKNKVVINNSPQHHRRPNLHPQNETYHLVGEFWIELIATSTRLLN